MTGSNGCNPDVFPGYWDNPEDLLLRGEHATPSDARTAAGLGDRNPPCFPRLNFEQLTPQREPELSNVPAPHMLYLQEQFLLQPLHSRENQKSKANTNLTATFLIDTSIRKVCCPSICQASLQEGNRENLKNLDSFFPVLMM